MRRRRLPGYERLRKEWREVGSKLFRQLTRDDILKAGAALGINRRGTLVLDDTGMDFENVADFAVFEVLLADPRRAAAALAVLPEEWRVCVTEGAASSYSIYEVLASDPDRCTVTVLDRLRAERRDIMDVNLSRSFSPRADLLCAWRLLRIGGIDMTSGAIALIAAEDLDGIRRSVERRIAAGASFRAAMVRTWPTIFRKSKRLGIAVASR